MDEKRIERTTSRTAAMTSMSRSASSMESNSHYQSNDHLAVKILPNFLRVLFKIPHFIGLRKLFVRFLALAEVTSFVAA